MTARPTKPASGFMLGITLICIGLVLMFIPVVGWILAPILWVMGIMAIVRKIRGTAR